jgi:hypothetical protein
MLGRMKKDLPYVSVVDVFSEVVSVCLAGAGVEVVRPCEVKGQFLEAGVKKGEISSYSQVESAASGEQRNDGQFFGLWLLRHLLPLVFVVLREGSAALKTTSLKGSAESSVMTTVCPIGGWLYCFMRMEKRKYQDTNESRRMETRCRRK